jgi:hypothetical protein
MYQQLWGYKVEEKLYLGANKQKKVEYHCSMLLTMFRKTDTNKKVNIKLFNL